MLYYKRLIVAKMYAEGDKESIEKKKIMIWNTC